MNRAALAVVCGAFMSCSTADPLHQPVWTARSQLQSSSTISQPDMTLTQTVGRVTSTTPWSMFNRLRGDHYALDDIARRVESPKHVKCDASLFQAYKGTHVPYAGAVRVDPAFITRLTRFEAIVNEVALEVYGRVPSRLIHAGAFSCRTSRNRKSRLSEHALGNALDVVGFSFPRATKAAIALSPTPIAAPFKVTVLQHWSAERTAQAHLHRDFLRKLASAVVAADVFRVVLGPSHPGHADHLHFDMSPWNYVSL